MLSTTTPKISRARFAREIALLDLAYFVGLGE
jgi:hypothetical protein